MALDAFFLLTVMDALRFVLNSFEKLRALFLFFKAVLIF